IERWVDFYRIVRANIPPTVGGYAAYQGLTAAMAIVILGVPAAGIGAVLPLMIRTRAGGEPALAKEVGALLTWNTLGAVAGTVLTGFVLMPRLGLRNAFGALALFLAIAAVVVARRDRWKPGMLGA